MAQHDYVISNGTGAAVRSDLNNALLAIVSQNSGATEPTTTYAYQWWADTTTGLLKIRNSANNAWITLRELDGTLTVEDGTVSAPGLAFRDDLNTGIWRPGTDQFAISTNGVERVEWGTSEVVFNDGGTNYDFRVEGDTNANLLFVDASADAVGIGTSSPATALDVNGTITARGSLIFKDANNSNTYGLRALSGIVAADTGTNYPTGWNFQYGNTSNSALYINSSGRVGIGTTSPGGLLDVYASSGNNLVRIGGAAGTSNGIYFRAQNTNYAEIYYSDSGSYPLVIGTKTGAGPIIFNTVDNERARIDSSGRLLVGTSSARQVWQTNPAIQAESTSFAHLSLVSNNNTDATISPVITLARTRGTAVGGTTAVQQDDSLGTIGFAGAQNSAINNLAASISCAVDSEVGTAGDTSDVSGRLVFSTTADGASSPTERMRITNSGVIRIAQTSSDDPSGSDIAGVAIGSGYISASRSSDPAGVFARRTTTGDIVLFRYGTTQIGTISTNGSSTSYNTTSDYRLKENLTPLTEALERLVLIPVHRFNFIGNSNQTVDGFIAHEVQAVVPEAITGEKDAVDDDGNPIYQGIDQSKLVPLLTAALQEAVAKIESLEARLTAAGI